MKVNKTEKEYLEVAKKHGVRSTAEAFIRMFGLEFLPEPETEEKWPERLKVRDVGSGVLIRASDAGIIQSGIWIDLSRITSEEPLSPAEHDRLRELIARYNTIEYLMDRKRLGLNYSPFINDSLKNQREKMRLSK